MSLNEDQEMVPCEHCKAPGMTAVHTVSTGAWRCLKCGFHGVFEKEAPPESQEPADEEAAAFLRKMVEGTATLGRAAVIDPEVMPLWNQTMPGVCPGCMKQHRRKGWFINRGLCVSCRYDLSHGKTIPALV